MKEDRIIEQLDKMVSSGRMTAEEAARLRATAGTSEFEAAMGEVRARHASAHLDSAVSAGQMTQEEADDQLQRLRAGEHPKGLRARLRMHRNSATN
jgi:polyhydroxyalkanoate synthesis regulator phasin